MQEEADAAEAKSAADRALLRRIVEAWDDDGDDNSDFIRAIDEARARIGEGK